jgi:hypothetical protein
MTSMRYSPRFLLKYGTKLLKGHKFNKLLDLIHHSWELEEELEKLDCQKEAIEELLKAMSGAASVEDDDPSPNF